MNWRQIKARLHFRKYLLLFHDANLTKRETKMHCSCNIGSVLFILVKKKGSIVIEYNKLGVKMDVYRQ